MKFKANDEQAKAIALKAIEASDPVGRGVWHYESELRNREVKIVHGDLSDSKEIDVDYYEGRMVKLYLWSGVPNIWNTPDNDPTPAYQSWCHTYKTYKDLVLSVEGVEEI